MIYFAVISFAVLPSIVWMLYYLQKDRHPEPKRFIIYVFLAGAVSGGLAYLFQSETRAFLLEIHYLLFIEKFIIIAFSEELFKYLAVYFTMMRNSELDEPVDIIIYMITAALGFAALENLFYLYSLYPSFPIKEMASLTMLRFVGATLLHVLASGFLGVFLVYGQRYSNHIITLLGFFVATILHGAYNMIVIRIEQFPFLFLLVFFLISLSVMLSVCINRIRKMKSVCFVK